MCDLNCLSCGVCCHFTVVPPFSHAEIKSLSIELATPILEVWAHATDPDVNFWDQRKTRVCSWFDFDLCRCMHYELRPKECIDFKAGNTHCLDLRSKAGVNSTVQLTIGESNAEHH